MIALGVVLLILGFIFGIHLLWTLGIVLLVIGAVLWILGSVGRPVAGRRDWYYPLARTNRLPDPVSQHTQRNGIARAQSGADTGTCDAVPSLSRAGYHVP